MKDMKKVLCLMAVLMILPLGASAQDDMYFSSSKKAKKEKTKSANKASSTVKADADTAYRTYDSDDVIFNGDGVEDEAVVNDTLYIDPYETFSDGEGEWVGGFNGSVDDYFHTKRVLQWANMGSAIPVGSSLYWNLVYGPYSYDWNIYKVGGLAYVTPTWSNPLYTHYQFDVTWGMHNWFSPWRHSWGYNWYSPWYTSHWGGFYDPWDPWYGYGYGIGWGHSWYGGWYGGHFGWTYPSYHWHYSGFPTMSRDRARGHLGSSDSSIRLGAANRSSLRGSVQEHRISDNRVQQRDARAGGHSVKQSQAAQSNSVRSAARNVGRELNTSETRSSTTTIRTSRTSDAEARSSRTQTTRTNSTYTRSADGRNRSTYTRPSSTRTTEATRNNSSVSTQQRSTTTRSSSARSMSESRNQQSTTVNRSTNTTTRSNNSSSFNSGRSGSSFSNGGGFSGGGSRGGGMSGGGGSRGGGGGRR